MTALAPAGVALASGVVINAPMGAFLAALRGEVPASIPLTVTSGVRTAEAQARALRTKRARHEAGKGGKYDDLRNLYKRGNGPQIVAALLAVPNTVPAMAKVLQSFIDRGIYLSRHMRGDAFDLRVRRGDTPFSPAERQTIIEAVKRLGGKALDEGDHIHVEDLDEGLLSSMRATAAKVEQAVSGKAETKLPVRRRRRWGRRAAALKRQSRQTAIVGLVLGGVTLLVLLAVWGLRRRRWMGPRQITG